MERKKSLISHLSFVQLFIHELLVITCICSCLLVLFCFIMRKTKSCKQSHHPVYLQKLKIVHSFFFISWIASIIYHYDCMKKRKGNCDSILQYSSLFSIIYYFPFSFIYTHKLLAISSIENEEEEEQQQSRNLIEKNKNSTHPNLLIANAILSQYKLGYI